MSTNAWQILDGDGRCHTPDSSPPIFNLSDTSDVGSTDDARQQLVECSRFSI